MIKRILIPLDPSPYSETAITIGCQIAKQFDAELTGLVVLDIPGIEKSIGPVPVGGQYYAEHLEEHKKKEASQRIHELLAKFKERCEQEGVRHREAERQGSPSEHILQESIFYDLVMVGLSTYYGFETSTKAGHSLEKLLDHSVTPIYGVPQSFSPPNIPHEKLQILIAFDGSLPAARALQRFAQLASPDIMEVTLLMSHHDEQTALYYLEQAEAYLHSHTVININKVSTSENIITAMKEKYLDKASIVVVGAHSKKGILHFKIGGLTKFLIKEGRKPLLIGQ